MKETIELEQCNTTVRFPKMIVVPKPKEFIRGGTAALVKISLSGRGEVAHFVGTFPINKVMFRQQLTGSGILSVGKDIYREGFQYL